MEPTLSRSALDLRAAHAGVSLGFLGAIAYVWWCGATRRRGQPTWRPDGRALA